MVPKPKSPLWGRSLRIQVEVNQSKPILLVFFLKNDEGVLQWIQLKYERLSNFCYNCGLIDHLDKDCISSTLAMISDSFGCMVQLYGLWVGTTTPIVSYFNMDLEFSRPSFLSSTKAPVVSISMDESNVLAFSAPRTDLESTNNTSNVAVDNSPSLA